MSTEVGIDFVCGGDVGDKFVPSSAKITSKNMSNLNVTIGIVDVKTVIVAGIDEFM
jgi:hypothetical protein